MGAALWIAAAHGQHRLSPVQSLDLALLVHAQHQRPLGRVQVQPHDVGDLVLQEWIGGVLEGLGAMGLQAVAPPDPQDRRRARIDLFGEPLCAPMGSARRPLQGCGDDLGFPHGVVGARTTRARLVTEILDALLGCASAPHAHGLSGGLEALGDLLVLQPLLGKQDDVGSEHLPLL